MQFNCINALILNWKRIVQSIYLTSVTLSIPAFAEASWIYSCTIDTHRIYLTHARAHDNVVLYESPTADARSRTESTQLWAILYRLDAYTRKAKEATRARRMNGEREKRRKPMYAFYMYSRLRETRWSGEPSAPGRTGERPAELWTHSGFLQVVPAGIG